MMSECVGLLAGNRRLPFLWAAQAKAAGYRVAAVGFKEVTDPRLAAKVDAFQMLPLGQLGRMIRFFKSQGVRRAVMQGQVRHSSIYADIKPDWRARWLLARQALWVRDFRTEAVLKSIAREFGRHGIELQLGTWLMGPHLASAGRQAGPRPSGALKRDIAFGLKLTRELNRLDVGQTVVVKKMSCAAVESIEGTDACILRGARLAGPGCTVVKLPRPEQDLRFDLPVIGPQTFRTLIKARAAALVIQAGKTVFLERERCLAQADRAGLCVIAEP